MGLFNWGALPKAQDNAQTIDEAIGAAIVAHESDPTAHLGDGESLQQHKNNEVIDHPAFSIVPDKFSNAEAFSLATVVPYNIDNKYNCELLDYNPLLMCRQDDSYTGEGGYQVGTFYPTIFGYDDGDIIFDFLISLQGTPENGVAIFSFSFGQIQLKEGFYRIGYFSTNTWDFIYSSWVATTEYNILHFRFWYDSTNHLLKVYLKNVEVFSVSYVYDIGGEDNIIIFWVNRGTSSDFRGLFGNIKYWYSGM